MSAYSIDTALAELESLINNCEKAVMRSIEEKNMKSDKSDKSVSINRINRQLQHNPIAIVGMASLLPQARNLREYWQNIVNKIDCITDVPSTHWSVEDYYDPNPRTTEDKTYCKRGGFLPEVDFNPMEFGIPPSILEVTDVSQLLSLLVAKEAMEDAGYGEKREFNREMVGVILGVAMAKQLGMPLSARLEYPIWEKALKSSGLSDEDTKKIVDKIKSAYVKWDENAFPGMLANVVAGRIANRLNFGGMNCVVDAACASSFGALKMAISELVEHRSDMMLTGGVDTDNTIMAYISFSKTPAVSPSENVKPFDAKSDGMMLGEGIGMIVLKRLEDAERDNDKIYAVIKGIGTSSDGRYKSIYAPRKEGQVKALERAYEDAGFSPATVGLMEAHGTGTMAGDPTEFGSLKDFFDVHDDKKQHIALGSVKSQIGHTKAAAGAASLIKTALALHHKVLPPTINITEPNPKLNIKNSSFYLNTQTRPWIRPEGEAPRRAGVSSFGFGGTNYHVVLEEYEADQNDAYRLHSDASEVLLFAPTVEQLLSKSEEMLGKLRSLEAPRHYSQLVNECKSQQIPLSAPRFGFVAENLEEACKLLQTSIDWLKLKGSAASWEHPQGIYYRSSGMELGGKVVSLFSGQGSQYLEMGRELVMNFPLMRRLHGYMDSLLLKDNLQPLSEIVFPHPVFGEAEKNVQIAALQRTEYAQPAIGVLSAGMYSILQQAGFKSDFVAGHSFGELTALWAAGVLSTEDYLFLVKARGQAMAAPEDPDHDAGSMLAVKEDISKVEAVLRHFPQVAIANQNSPTQIVLAGPTAEIARIKEALHEKGYTAVLLPVSAAFHTPLIAFAQKSFAIATKSVKFQSPKIPVYSNVTSKQYPKEPQGIQKILETHLSNSVLFKQEIENIYAAGGTCFVEFGPRRILSNLVKEILGDRPHITVSLNPSVQKNSDRSLREAVVQLRVIGLALNNLDPYQLPQTIPPIETKKTLNVRLNGINYRSEKTKNAFALALQDGHKVTLPTPEYSETVAPLFSNPGVTPPFAVIETNGHKKSTATMNGVITQTEQQMNPVTLSQPAQESKMQPTPEKLTNYEQLLASLEYLLTQFQENQAENLQVHGTYLNHQMEYAKAFFQLMLQQNSLLSESKSTAETAKMKLVVMESLERSMMQFHSQQGETLRIHEQYLQEQLEYTKSFFQLIQQEYSQIISGEGVTQLTEKLSNFTPFTTETTVSDAPVPATTKIVESQPLPVTEPVAKNGLNVTQAPLPAAVEPVVEAPVSPETRAIASLLPTPHFATVETVEPPAPVVEPQAEVVVKISSPPVNDVVAFTPEPAPTTAAPVSGATIDIVDLDKNLLAITSDKTGYPVEMLEMDMDMEADLGIDSIKRVEILGALQEMYPNLPKPNLEELSEKRTIGQVVEYLQSHASKSVSVEIAVHEIQQATEIAVEVAPVVEVVAAPEPSIVVAFTPEPEASPTPATSDEFANLGETLLAITSDKTGYPVEMLELEMDMEADLGIDSIKRVEILGAMQEMYPNLPKPNIEELGDLRTIGQIVDYLQQLAGGEKKKSEPEFVQQQPPELEHNIPRYTVKLRSLPQPDYLDFTLPEGHIGLITDDGSLTTYKLAESLIEKGWKVVVISFPQSLIAQQAPLPTGVTRVTLANLSEEHLQQQLQAIASHCGAIGAFIHLHPMFVGNHTGSISYNESEKAIVKHVFLMAKHLKPSLNEAAKHGRSCFCTVAHLDGAFGLEYKVNFGAIGAGLFGLTKTLRWEWPKVFTRAIDLSPRLDAKQSVQNIIAELHDPNLYISEVGYGSQGRVTIIAD
ncbi:acyltransferase domain-containing protein [Nostoc sp. UCD121]|uniref:type I polyketide synthase n=1 Tax=unclassified Nostoc TaxID=2593658 RepID=UPI001623FBF8|nr:MULTISPECIES: type I polyketide synthase [unclassified Nostoc]MBC1221536.1 acyltransferase domain-containing protein [Nostoc sp. UCD120]MBC1277180.1 acyltransferase domain-containing protein [Nostoc sp. UCD121]MBC1295708.1 acyltransferase domain-containing protein [Nostoc sp. UCD122]